MHPKCTPRQYIAPGLCQCGCGNRVTIRRDGRFARFHTGHSPRRNTAERPLPYTVDEATGCWNWSGTMMGTGYGCLLVEGATVYAHRFSYEQVNDPIPTGWHIHHRCENRRCIRPDHLEAVSPSEHGVRHSVLSREDRNAICRLAKTMLLKDVASVFGISEHYASFIALGRDLVPGPKRVYVDDVVSPEMEREILSLCTSMSQRKIAAHLAIERSQVRAVLARHGMARR